MVHSQCIAQIELANPPTDAISSIQFAPDSLRILVASWDKNAYLYDTSQPGGRLLKKYEHRAPVLDVCFGGNDEVAYTAGLDWNVQRSVVPPMSKMVQTCHIAALNRSSGSISQRANKPPCPRTPLALDRLSSPRTTTY